MKLFFIIVASLVIVSPLFTQQVDTDSSSLYLLNEVVVTATRSPIAAGDSPSQVTILNSRDIRSTNSSTLGGVFSQSGGLFVRQNGGGGSIATLSMRGGASEHLLVLIDGVRYSGFQNGLVDLNLLPVNTIDRIEIVHGGSSALYGADALAGVVNILTRESSGGSHFRTELGFGSFGRSRAVLEGESKLGILGFIAGYSRERGRDDYSFDVAGTPDRSAVRTNADFAREQYYVQANVGIDDRSRLNVVIQDVASDRGSPGPFDPNFDSNARLFDENVHVSANYSRSDGQNLDWLIATAYDYGYETFDVPDVAFPYHTFYKNAALNVNSQLRWRPLLSQTLTIGGEFGQGGLEGPDFGSRVQRVEKAFYMLHEARFDLDRPMFNRFSFYTALRADHITDVDNAFTPKFGVNIRVASKGDLRIRSSIGRSFRAPSFNDLYFIGFSNPALTAEHSTSFDAGISAVISTGLRHSIGLTYFLLNTDDRILFDPVASMPVNVGKVRSSGVEIKYLLGLSGGSATFGLNYSYTAAVKLNSDSLNDPTFEKQLASLPKELLGASFSCAVGPVTLNGAFNFIGERFIAADNSQSLPAYRLTSFNIIWRSAIEPLKPVLKAEVSNVFDVDYQVFNQYPMPRRNYQLTLGLEY